MQLTQRVSEWTLAGGPTKARMAMRSVVLRTGQLPFLGSISGAHELNSGTFGQRSRALGLILGVLEQDSWAPQ